VRPEPSVRGLARRGTHLSEREKHERKQRVLTKTTPSLAGSIADAVVIKNGDLFFLTDPDGRVPLKKGHGLGLYYHDCRFLDGYEVQLGGAYLDPLAATAGQGCLAVFELTNPDLRTADDRLIPKETLGVRWERTIAGQLTLHDLLTFQNYGPDEAGVLPPDTAFFLFGHAIQWMPSEEEGGG